MIDRVILQSDVTRNRIEPRTMTRWTRDGFLFIDPFGFALGRELVLQDGIPVIFGAGLLLLIPNLAKAAALFAGAVR